MPVVLFPDTCLLINFASVRRTDLLRKVVRDKGRWTYTVCSEVKDKARNVEWAELTTAHEFLNEPLLPDARERIDTMITRDIFAKPGGVSSDNLGEAETFAIASNRFDSASVVILTEDTFARSHAINSLNFQVMGTKDVLSIAVKMGEIEVDQANQICRDLRARKRPVYGFPPLIEAHPAPTASVRTSRIDVGNIAGNVRGL